MIPSRARSALPQRQISHLVSINKPGHVNTDFISLPCTTYSSFDDEPTTVYPDTCTALVVVVSGSWVGVRVVGGVVLRQDDVGNV